jgi:hypothetical protein
LEACAGAIQLIRPLCLLLGEGLSVVSGSWIGLVPCCWGRPGW